MTPSGDTPTDTDGDRPLSDLTKKVLGEKPASAPKSPVEEIEDEVIDPLLGGTRRPRALTGRASPAQEKTDSRFISSGRASAGSSRAPGR